VQLLRFGSLVGSGGRKQADADVIGQSVTGRADEGGTASQTPEQRRSRSSSGSPPPPLPLTY